MKLRKLLFKTMPVIVLSTGLVTSIASCSNGNYLPKVTSHEVRNALLNKLVSDSWGNLYYTTSKYGTIEVHHFNGSEVGYINVDDYVNTLMQFEDIYGSDTVNYSSKTENYKTTITNSNNNSKGVIDYEQQTITFDDYDMFGCEEKAYAENPLAVGAGGGEKYYFKNGESYLWDAKYVSGGQYVIDLKKYNIKAYYDDGKGYLPYDVYRNLLNRNPITYMFYNGKDFYEVSTSNSSETIDLYKDVKDEATIFTEEYMLYCYNLLALTLDTKFGLTERLGRSPENKGKTITYFKDGAYAALEPYKTALTSLEPNIANDAMCQVFQNLADDGGHAGYSGLDILCTRPHESVRGYEKIHTFDTMDMVKQSRDLAYEGTGNPIGPDDYWQSTKYDDYITLYTSSGKTPIMYITFDSFKAVSQYTTTRELEKGKVVYDDVKIDQTSTIKNNNYMYDTIRMTMGANKYFNQYNADHPTAKINDIVLDLTNNGGGTVYTEHVLASWLCGGVKEKIWNPHTKAYAEYTIKANLNDNTEFKVGEDYLAPTVNVYCLTSDTSFSCGNMLPCNLVDNRSADHTFFIGCPSGGGACFVDGNMHIGLGNVFRSSSNYHMLRGSSTQTNHVSVESGHLEDKESNFFHYIPSTWETCTQYVDRATINDKIWERV